MSNYETLFHRLNTSDGYDMWKDTKDLLKGIPAPQVEVYCWHGINVPTTEKLVYSEYRNATRLTLQKGNGDGTVNLRSMNACLKWRNEQIHDVHYRTFQNINHLGMMTEDEP